MKIIEVRATPLNKNVAWGPLAVLGFALPMNNRVASTAFAKNGFPGVSPPPWIAKTRRKNRETVPVNEAGPARALCQTR